MDKVCGLFMEAVGAALKNEAVTWGDEVSGQEWLQVLRIAELHRMLPMVYQAIYRTPAAKQVEPQLFSRYKMIAIQMVAIQAQKTAEFLPLLAALRNAGAEPMVVKGILCRRLYPEPDYRMSSDEDVLILPELFPRCHEVLTRYGLTTADPDTDAYEIPYARPGGVLYLEIHRSLFPEGHDAYGEMNEFFRDIRSRAVEVEGVPTLCPTDHMLYLLCHAFKHFLHSGFGIRQVCDLILFANRFGKDIDWEEILEKCRIIRAEKFAAGLFRIGWKYLHFSLEASGYPLQWQAIYVDEAPLLDDILFSGIYGDASMSRKHSSNITLKSVSAQKQGKKAANPVLKTIFPSAKDLEGRFPYLKDKPVLLPVAWTERILRYGKETAGASGNTPGNSLRIGNDRVALLKKYGVLDS